MQCTHTVQLTFSLISGRRCDQFVSVQCILFVNKSSLLAVKFCYAVVKSVKKWINVHISLASEPGPNYSKSESQILCLMTYVSSL